MSKSLQLLTSLLAAAFICQLTSCRIVSPDVPEQQKLVADKTFAGGTPAWLSPSVSMDRRQGSGTIIPSTLSAPYAVSGRSEEIHEEMQEKAEERVKTEDLAKTEAEEKEKNSPLARMAATCPGQEAEITAALTTVDRAQRIGKYERLTKPCGSSSDLWTWLGNDYAKENRLQDARRAYERALVLNAGNVEAKSSLAEVNQRLSINAKPQRNKGR